jgi:phospholipid/cholesterol/gamma-HCH transport system substrate-binding protein
LTVETKANHVLIGLFTLAVIAAILLFILWASKYSAEGTFHEFDIVFNESVTGLSVGGVVEYNGIEVGNVRNLKLEPNDARKVIARIRVSDDTPIKVDTRVELALQSFATGVAFIQLSGGKPESALIRQTDPHHVPVLVASESSFQHLLNSSEDIATTLNDVLTNIKNILSSDNAQHIGKTLANLQALTDTLAAQRDGIASLIKSANQASAHLDATLASAEKIMGQVNQQLGGKLPGMVDHLDHTLTQLDSFTKDADAMLAADRGAIDNFSNQGLAQLGPTLAQMRQVLRQVDSLVSQLQANPAGYLLGRNKPKEFQPK